ncbi:YEATS domain-containing protein 4 [Glugoides intestinalis]
MQGYNTIPIVIGSEAVIVPEERRAFQELSHEWKCYVKATPGLIKTVQFRLHESFKNPYINVYEEPFQIIEKGWGEFTIQIKITLFNDEKINTNHYLKLHSTHYPLISEKVDTVAYKGDPIAIEHDFNFKYEKDDEEYKKIDDGISYMLDLLENRR